jgi:L-amino acid N-acyltransferase YncA
MIELRAATPADADHIAAIYAPYVATNAVSYEVKAPTTREMKTRITKTIDQYPWIVADDRESGVILGYAYARPFRDGQPYRFAVETAAYVAGELEGQGLRRTLYQTLLNTLTEQNFTQAISRLTMPNDKTIQLHEAVGFKRAGVYREVCFKNGQWIDIGLFQRDLADPQTPPEELKLFADVGIIKA